MRGTVRLTSAPCGAVLRHPTRPPTASMRPVIDCDMPMPASAPSTSKPAPSSFTETNTASSSSSTYSVTAPALPCLAALVIASPAAPASAAMIDGSTAASVPPPASSSRPTPTTCTRSRWVRSAPGDVPQRRAEGEFGAGEVVVAEEP